MTKDELTDWAMKNGWQMIGGHPSLTRPNRPAEAIVRLVLKGTVVQLEIKKPAGKWDKIASAPYAKLVPDDETGMPIGLGLDTIAGFSMLMQDNKNRAVFRRRVAKGLTEPIPVTEGMDAAGAQFFSFTTIGCSAITTYFNALAFERSCPDISFN